LLISGLATQMGEIGAMPLREAEYRGYHVLLEPDGESWRITVWPADSPSLGRRWLRTPPMTEDEAMVCARQWINGLLSE
jgi:hypothetical protein